MALSRTERFGLKSRLIDELTLDNGWDLNRKNLLLSEFGLETLDGDSWNDPGFEDLIAAITDSDLIEMYSIVTGVDQDEVKDVVEAADSGNWKPGYVRLFISHSARHKRFIGEVADELAVTGIHGFVAHDTMTYSKPWQAQIEQALKSMQAFVAVVHPEFQDSAWCHQEVGWALGRRVPKYVVRMGVDPVGFIGHEQWPAGHDQTPKQIAQIISRWASSIPELGETMTDGLFAALESAGNYMDAGATADRIASLGSLTKEQWGQLDDIWWRNDQLYTGALPTKVLKPFYAQHGRKWPPPKPAPPARAKDPWATTPATSEEPPF
jgi:hypothetical protein